MKELPFEGAVREIGRMLAPLLKDDERLWFDVVQNTLLSELEDDIVIRARYMKGDGMAAQKTYRKAYYSLPQRYGYHYSRSELAKDIGDAIRCLIRLVRPDPPPLFRIGTRAKMKMRKR